MELRQGSLKGSPAKVAQAYRDVTRVMADEASSLWDLQGAVEYLLDALKDAQEQPFQGSTRV